MTPCSDVVGYHHFGGLCSVHLQGKVIGVGKGDMEIDVSASRFL